MKASYFRKSHGDFSLPLDIYRNCEVMFVHSLNWLAFKEGDKAFKAEFSEFKSWFYPLLTLKTLGYKLTSDFKSFREFILSKT